MLSITKVFTLLATLGALLPGATAAAIQKRGGKQAAELSTHYDVAGYTKDDLCGKLQGVPDLDIGKWSNPLQADPGACGYGGFHTDGYLVAVSQSIFKLSDCGKEIELFKPDGTKVDFGGKPLIYAESCPGCGVNRLDVSVPLLWHLDDNACTAPLQGYSYTITNKQIIKSGGNPGTPGYTTGAEIESARKAKETAERLQAAAKPVDKTRPKTKPKAKDGGAAVACDGTHLEGCSKGIRHICDYTTNAVDGRVWVPDGSPCLPGSFNF